MVSLLVPTRQRPEALVAFYNSAIDTADKPGEVEVVCYIDLDDDSYKNINFDNLVKVFGPREMDGKVNLSQMWNLCWEAAKGPYYGHMGDDIRFRTKGWDSKIKEAIDCRPGKICFAHGNDHDADSDRSAFGTHGFIHRNWTDVVGRFVPPYFSSDYNDTWLNDIANALHVRTYLPDVWTEHLHFTLGKSEKDKVTEERLERHISDGNPQRYDELATERGQEIEKLREFINEHQN